MKEINVIVIGGGASGLTAAMQAAVSLCNSKVNITVLEHKDKPGKKLLATGNGRCNFTNDIMDEESYRGENNSFAYNVINRFNKDKLCGYFNEIGILHTNINGYYYPRSLQATTVLDSICAKLDELGVMIKCDAEVTNITKRKKDFLVETNTGNYNADYVVVATGGKSYKNLGSDGSGYKILKSFGHTVTGLYPALSGLKASGMDFKACHGVRAKGNISLYVDDVCASESYGEIQFADYGVSGIPVFQVSRYAAKALSERKKVHMLIDFAYEYDYKDVLDTLSYIADNNKSKSIEEVVNAFVPIKLSRVLVKDIAKSSKQINMQMLKRVASALKKTKIIVTGDCGFEKAQVTAGGIVTNEIDINTMESKLCKNMFITGEILDIDGNCGGYNLHFAFATGILAGMSIGKKVLEND